MSASKQKRKRATSKPDCIVDDFGRYHPVSADPLGSLLASIAHPWYGIDDIGTDVGDAFALGMLRPSTHWPTLREAIRERWGTAGVARARTVLCARWVSHSLNRAEANRLTQRVLLGRVEPH